MKEHEIVSAVRQSAGIGREYDHLAAQLPDEYPDLVGTEPVRHH
jgi:hypothetical protein